MKVNESEDKVDVSFLFKVENSVRQFNLIVSPDDNLETITVRISTVLQKAIQKDKGIPGRFNTSVSFFDATYNTLSPKTLCQELFDLKEQLKLKIDDQYYDVLFDVPWIVDLNLPQSILTGFPVHPEYSNRVTNFVEEEKTDFKWYKGVAIDENGKEINDTDIKWEIVCIGPSYTPCFQDIGKKLKLECKPGNETLVGPDVEVISKNVVEAGPEKCPFERRHKLTTEKLSGKSFRCVSYNILADCYCDTDYTRTELHPYCPVQALHIDYRKQLLMKELLGYNADVLCLQEVDLKVFENYLQPLLRVEGLVGKFYIKDVKAAEGLACFYRKDRFRFLGEQTIVLTEALKTQTYLQSIWGAIVNNEPLCKTLLDMPQVASVTILQSNDNPNEILMVGNTHLYYHIDAEHIRLIQGGVVIYWLRNLRNHLLKQNPSKRVTLIICGDFNSVPSSGVYQLYTTGVSSDSLPDWKSNSNEAISSLTLEQDICLASACGTPPYTNFSTEFAGCIDYIYYDSSNLEVEQVVSFPSLEELQAHTALPSIVFPSDHIALISDLRFI